MSYFKKIQLHRHILLFVQDGELVFIMCSKNLKTIITLTINNTACCHAELTRPAQ